MSERELARELPDGTLERIGDARAQLWARVYAATFDQGIRGCVREITKQGLTASSDARSMAREQADAAVRDFDEHYLGSKS